MKMLKFGETVTKNTQLYSQHQDSSSDDNITRAISSAVSSYSSCASTSSSSFLNLVLYCVFIMPTNSIKVLNTAHAKC